MSVTTIIFLITVVDGKVFPILHINTAFHESLNIEKSPFLQGIEEHMFTMPYAKRTVESYARWLKYFMIYYKKQHPSELGSNEVRPFINSNRVRLD